MLYVNIPITKKNKLSETYIFVALFLTTYLSDRWFFYRKKLVTLPCERFSYNEKASRMFTLNENAKLNSRKGEREYDY